MKTKKLSDLTGGALIAALYTALCFAFPPLSFGAVQLRFSEVLCVLPAIYSPAIAGLTLGCFLSNLIGLLSGLNPLGFIDCAVGSAATFLAAMATAAIGRRFRGRRLYLLAPLPPVVFNALMVGAEMTFLYLGRPSWTGFLLSCGYIAAGEAACCYLGGLVLLRGCQEILKRKK